MQHVFDTISCCMLLTYSTLRAEQDKKRPDYKLGLYTVGFWTADGLTPSLISGYHGTHTAIGSETPC